MDGRRIGALIAAIAGLVFIVINAGELPEHVALVVRVLGVLGFLAVLLFSVIRRVPGAEPGERPVPQAFRVYWLSVVGEVLAIVLGARVINTVLERPKLVVLWVVFVVGVHFLPFTKAFRTPLFRPLAWALIGLAIAGAVVALTVDVVAAPIAAILAGVALLTFSLASTGRYAKAGIR